MIWVALQCLALGGLAGFLAGLLGIGGGLLMVPFFAWILPAAGMPSEQIMQVAVGTSLSVIALTSLSSTLAHHRRGGVMWPVFKALVPGLILGALIGAAIADVTPGLWLKRIVGVAALLVAVKMMLNIKPAPHREIPAAPGLFVAGNIIGSISALIGIGGGSLTVPFLNWCNTEMKRAVGTAAACGIPIAWAGAVGFIWAGMNETGLPGMSLGYVYLPALLATGVASISLAPLGARAAHALPAAQLKKVFAMLLLAIGLKMLFF